MLLTNEVYLFIIYEVLLYTWLFSLTELTDEIPVKRNRNKACTSILRLINKYLLLQKIFYKWSIRVVTLNKIFQNRHYWN